jgi:hypothetical protein
MRNIIIVACFILIFFSCKPNRFKVDTSSIEVHLKINRLEQWLFEKDPVSFENNLVKITDGHTDFFSIYTNYVLNIGTPESEGFRENLNFFLTDTVITRVADTSLILFSNIEEIENQLTKGFKHYKYYFPENEIPEIYTCLTGFNQSVFITDNGIGIGLDKYLGSDCVFYTYLGIPQYKTNNMHPQKIVPDLFYSIFMSDYPFMDSLSNLLSNMVYQGKAIYFIKSMCPTLPDSIIMGYTANQINWCKAHEPTMWTYLVENKLLYDTERLTLQRYVGDAPFTATFSDESPGRAGIWLGYKIVLSFMNKNPEVSLNELIALNNAQEILNKSGYYPE